jgi:hypothetical protein
MRESGHFLVLGTVLPTMCFVCALLNRGEPSAFTTSVTPVNRPTARTPSRSTARRSHRPTTRPITDGPLAALTGANQGAAYYRRHTVTLLCLPLVLLRNSARRLPGWLTAIYDSATGLGLRARSGLRSTAACQELLNSAAWDCASDTPRTNP